MKSLTRTLPSLALVASCVVGVACSGDDHDDSHEDLPASCQAIVDACHAVDDGTGGTAGECHTLAHEGKAEADCAAQKARCVAACEAMTPDGGGDHDGGADHDGEDHHDGG